MYESYYIVKIIVALKKKDKVIKNHLVFCCAVTHLSRANHH